jgi:CRP-like cAMP-binding protein
VLLPLFFFVNRFCFLRTKHFSNILHRFLEFEPSEIELLSKSLLIIRFKAHEAVMSIGEQATFAAVVISGTINVTVNTPKFSENEVLEGKEQEYIQTVVPLGVGAMVCMFYFIPSHPIIASPFFDLYASRLFHRTLKVGEMAYFERGYRTATVHCGGDGDAVLAVISFSELDVNDHGPEWGLVQQKLVRSLARQAVAKLKMFIEKHSIEGQKLSEFKISTSFSETSKIKSTAQMVAEANKVMKMSDYSKVNVVLQHRLIQVKMTNIISNIMVDVEVVIYWLL